MFSVLSAGTVLLIIDHFLLPNMFFGIIVTWGHKPEEAGHICQVIDNRSKTSFLMGITICQTI